MRSRHLLLVEPLRLGEDRLSLHVQVLLEKLELGAVAIWLGRHPGSL